ncbi:MAG TPA: sigma 54-interacting transcriptional regulator [Thermoanaerobaculia bacterium]|jgi:DNA-binding NtrC family response regulator
MVLRLIVEAPDRVRRFRLAEGENRLGSGPGCRVCIPHPSISRQHAVIFVHDGHAEVEDLGSRNGTRVNGRAIRARQAWDVGQTLTLGSVKVRLEEVDDKDLEAAVTFARRLGDAPAGPAAPSGEASLVTTVRVGSLQAFTLELLPELLARLARRCGAVSMAQEVGGALFKTLPCLTVEVLSRERDGLIFQARRDADVAIESHAAEAESDRYKLRVDFLNERQAQLYAPVLESGALLVRLAAELDQPEPGAAPPARASPPPLPEPATLVPRVRQIYADAWRIALGDIGVVICGESGTGKEVLARYLHAASPRSAGPFVALNCAALARDLLESELFGIESGVATGVEPRPGKFEMADGGTLFLDEIGDMALETQARILRVLQEGEVYRLGGQKPRSADVRVVAATNRDVERMMSDGSFRSDLYHRIADWTVVLPPLRERRADVANLAAFFLDQETRRRGVAAAGISRGALELLEGYPWPGNIRQLEREMARVALFLEAGELLESTQLREGIRHAQDEAPASLKERLDRVEREEIVQALERHDGSVSAAAKELQLGVSTLYRRISELGIETQD